MKNMCMSAGNPKFINVSYHNFQKGSVTWFVVIVIWMLSLTFNRLHIDYDDHGMGATVRQILDFRGDI